MKTRGCVFHSFLKGWCKKKIHDRVFKTGSHVFQIRGRMLRYMDTYLTICLSVIYELYKPVTVEKRLFLFIYHSYFFLLFISCWL